MNIPRSDRRLLDAITDYVASSPHPDVQRYHGNVSCWGDRYVPVEPVVMPAVDTLSSGSSLIGDDVSELFAALKEFIPTHVRRMPHEESAELFCDRIAEAAASQGFAFTTRLI